MKLDVFLQKSSNLYAENRLLKFCMVALTVAVVISSFFSYEALKYQKVVILPPVVDRRIEIKGTDVNDDYIKLFTRYMTTLMFTYTPGTVDGQFDELLKLATPGFYSELKARLAKIAVTIKQLSVTGAFYPKHIKIDRKARTIEVKGLKEEYTRGIPVKNGEAAYQIKYQLINGRFYVAGFKEIKD